MTQQGGKMFVFHGAPYQRGYGIGSFFQSLARRALPFLQQGAKTLGKAALNTGVNIAQDVLAGKSLKDSTRSRVQQTAQTLKEQALNRLQTGRGRKRLKRKALQKKTSSRQTSKVKRAKKVSRKRKQNNVPVGLVKKHKVNHLTSGDIFT